jgi:hypothetical protein
MGDILTLYVYKNGYTNGWSMGINSQWQGGFVTGLDTTASYPCFPWVYGGVLEVQDFTQCDDLPANGSDYFHDISVYVNGSPATPSFAATNVGPCIDGVWANSTSGGFDWTNYL